MDVRPDETHHLAWIFSWKGGGDRIYPLKGEAATIGLQFTTRRLGVALGVCASLAAPLPA